MTATKDSGVIEALGPFVTAGFLKAIAPRAPFDVCEQWAPHIDQAAWAADIITPAHLSWWLGQGLYECDQFRQLIEAVSPSTERYEGGSDYRGRGLGHLTHLGNYAAYGKSIGVDLVEHPELVAMPEYSSKIWAMFWLKMGGNALVDAGRFEATSSAIHRGDPNKPCLPSTHHEIRAAFAERGLWFFGL